MSSLSQSSKMQHFQDPKNQFNQNRNQSIQLYLCTCVHYHLVFERTRGQSIYNTYKCLEVHRMGWDVITQGIPTNEVLS